jgi:hypothetical protein
MPKILFALCALAIAAPAALADPVPVEPTDKPVIKQESGDTLMWEVPEKNTKPKAVSPEEQQKIDQAVYNQASYMQQAAQQNILPPPSDGTAPGAITPPFLPYSTVPGGPYNVSGSVMTPFNNRNYSYGGTSQSFGAPMFYGNEIPNPALAYPAGYPLGGAPVLPLMPQQRPAAGIPGTSATPVVPLPAQPSPQGLAVPRSNVMFPDND